jgi:uncharacterized protein (TIGR02145 family)
MGFFSKTGTFTDKRDGKTYKTVKIGKHVWMAENLSYQPKTGNAWCYNNDESMCARYGRLYDWNTAKAACPEGWHLPTNQEWNSLLSAAGGGAVAGSALKSVTGWNMNGNGADKFGFSALPGGYRLTDGNFDFVGKTGYWWTATDCGSGNAYRRFIRHDFDGVGEYEDGFGFGFSVRCVAN